MGIIDVEMLTTAGLMAFANSTNKLLGSGSFNFKTGADFWGTCATELKLKMSVSVIVKIKIKFFMIFPILKLFKL